jgi:threonine aldolase
MTLRLEKNMAFDDGIIDLRSDTVTRPTLEMRKAMYEAEVGDDFWGDDFTVIRLQEKVAEIFKREAALLVLSGTIGNSISIFSQAKSGQEIIIESRSHLWRCEATHLSTISRVTVQLVPGDRGVIDPGKLKSYIRGFELEEPRTALVSVETSHNGAGGTIIPAENIAAISAFARSNNLAFHIDGARIFNATVELGIKPAEYISGATSVMFSLSKGLCCPQCSMIVGSKAFIDEARRWRLTLGGHLRQGGFLAAPGIVALDTMIDRLKEDNENARYLAKTLIEDGAAEIDIDSVQTNIIRLRFHPIYRNGKEFTEYLAKNGIKVWMAEDGSSRLVTHYWINRFDIEKVLSAIRKYAKNKS